MEIREDREGDVVVLTPNGDMDVTTLPLFEQRLDRLLGEGVRAVLWDLAGVGILPSTSLGFLLHARRRLESVDGKMALSGANRIVRATLKTMGVLDVFPHFETRAEGVAALAQ